MHTRRSVRLDDEAPGVVLDWDTEFWGVRIGRVVAEELTEERLQDVDRWADELGLACVYYLAPGTDAASAHVAESGGFRLMDLRVELRRDAAPTPRSRGVREALPADRERLREIAAGSHGVTRFYADPHFPDERCDLLYATWIERSLEGWAATVLVAERDGEPVGYCSCHLDQPKAVGSIGLIAVDEDARGGGVGLALASAAVDWCAANGARTMSVVTQGRNAGALRTFQRAGFLVSSIDLWFHKWYDR